MHMADALVSPAVGGTMLAVTAGTIAYCSAKVRRDLDDRKVPLMGVLGAFLFAVQMINFTIPATGSSGHLGGGLLLSILLGPHAAFLTIASVLVVQALLFADGGLLALGCNIFNLGLLPAFIAYPLIYRKITGPRPSRGRLNVATIVAAIAGVQMGAFSVVLETVSSGITSLPFTAFVAFMLPIHLAIGIVEGVVTAAVVSFVDKARPEIVRGVLEAQHMGNHTVRNVVLAFLVAALLSGGIFSRFTSGNPDGLEWSIARVTGKEELKGREQGVHGLLSALQGGIALLPEYSFRRPSSAATEVVSKKGDERGLGTSVAGIVGGFITLGMVFLIGVALKRRTSAG